MKGHKRGYVCVVCGQYNELKGNEQKNRKMCKKCQEKRKRDNKNKSRLKRYYREKMIRYFHNSLDLDWLEGHQQESLSCSKEQVQHIINKIVKCKYCVTLSYTLSNYKGYHVEFYCTKQCDLCRLQFDDIRRYEEDLNRLPQFRNLIFDVKHGY